MSLRSRMLQIGVLLAAMLFVFAAGCKEESATGTSSGSEPTPNGLSEIPEDTTGVTATEIKLGIHMPMSGMAAVYGTGIVPGVQAYFDYINDVEGGVNGRKIKLVVGDDAYEPATTNEAVRRMVEQDKIFALIGGLGTPQHAAVFEYLKQAKVPDLFIASGATEFTDPVTRTAFGLNPNYVQEGTALGKYIAEKHPNAKIGLIIQNDDFGKDGEKGIRAGIEGSNAKIVDKQTYEATSTDLTSQVQNVKNAGADVLVFYALPRQAGSIVKVARGQLNWNVPTYASGIVADSVTIMLMGGQTADGVTTVAYLRPLKEASDAGVKKHLEIMKKYKPDVQASNFSLYGQSIAEMAVEALKKAGPNLNRRSLIEGTESMKGFTCSVCLTPISFSPTDHRAIESFQFASVKEGEWTPFGDIVSMESTK